MARGRGRSRRGGDSRKGSGRRQSKGMFAVIAKIDPETGRVVRFYFTDKDRDWVTWPRGCDIDNASGKTQWPDKKKMKKVVYYFLDDEPNMEYQRVRLHGFDVEPVDASTFKLVSTATRRQLKDYIMTEDFKNWLDRGILVYDGTHLFVSEAELMKMSSNAASNVPLKRSANGWKKTEAKDVIEALQKALRAVLNKLTLQTLLKLSGKIVVLIRGDEPETVTARVEVAVAFICSKIGSDALQCETYAKLCEELVKAFPSVQPLLVAWCRTTLQRSDGDETIASLDARIQELTGEHRAGGKDVSGTVKELKRRRRDQKQDQVGHALFVAELFKSGIVGIEEMRGFVSALLHEMDDEDVENVCMILTSIGSRLDTALADAWFATLHTEMQRFPPRLKFMIMDLIELRTNRWIPRRKTETPKMIEDIHEEERREQRAQSVSAVTWRKHTGHIASPKAVPPRRMRSSTPLAGQTRRKFFAHPRTPRLSPRTSAWKIPLAFGVEPKSPEVVKVKAVLSSSPSDDESPLAMRLPPCNKKAVKRIAPSKAFHKTKPDRDATTASNLFAYSLADVLVDGVAPEQVPQPCEWTGDLLSKVTTKHLPVLEKMKHVPSSLLAAIQAYGTESVEEVEGFGTFTDSNFDEFTELPEFLGKLLKAAGCPLEQVSALEKPLGTTHGPALLAGFANP